MASHDRRAYGLVNMRVHHGHQRVLFLESHVYFI